MPQTTPTPAIRELERGKEHLLLWRQSSHSTGGRAGAPGAELLHWRLRENPSGLRCVLAEGEEGQLLAHQQGIPRRVRMNGEDVIWTELVDAYVDPECSKGLRRSGAYVRTAREFAARYGGVGEGQDRVLYGLPTPAAHRILGARLGAEVIRNQNLLVARASDVPAFDAATPIIEERADFPPEVESLFERAAAACGAIAVRDRSFLTWRFSERPHISYRIACAWRGAKLSGYAVYREGEFDRHRGGLVCDWLVDPEDDDAGRALRAWLTARARRAGVQELVAVSPETCADFTAFQRAGFRVRPSSLFLVARSYSRGNDMLWLYHSWYYSLADFDCC